MRGHYGKDVLWEGSGRLESQPNGVLWSVSFGQLCLHLGSTFRRGGCEARPRVSDVAARARARVRDHVSVILGAGNKPGDWAQCEQTRCLLHTDLYARAAAMRG